MADKLLHVINPKTGRYILKSSKKYKQLIKEGLVLTPNNDNIAEAVNLKSKEVQKLIEDNIDLFDEGMEVEEIESIVRNLLKKNKNSTPIKKRKITKYRIEKEESESEKEEESESEKEEESEQYF